MTIGRCLNWFDFEMKTDEREHQALQVLNEIVEEAQAFGIFRLVDIQEGADFRRGEGNVLISDQDFELLTSNSVSWWPQRVILSHDFRILDDALQFLHDGCMDVSLLADHCVVLVVGIVGVSK